jgi:acetyltransferase-like isoleucine patch superfamily enzyme
MKAYLLSKISRKIIYFAEKLRSTFRIISLNFLYPSMHISFSSYIGKNCKITCADSGEAKIINTFINDGTQIKIEENAFFSIIKSSIGQYSTIVAHHKISIGNNCSIAELVTIRDQDHKIIPGMLIEKSGYTTKEIILNNNVWIGAKSTILKGVELGDNVVVGANSLVNKSVNSNTIVAGVPAKSINKS